MDQMTVQNEKLQKIEIREVHTRKDLSKFIHLPATIHQNHPNWVPPIYMDDWEFFNPKKNKSFDSCDAVLLLAFRNKQVVGRIMGIIHRKYNEKHQEKNARFAFFETWNDEEVVTALISSVENWAREKGMDRLVGPLAFSDKDPQGFLIEGFDEPAVIASNCNFPYQSELVEKCDYSKEVDLVVYQIKVPNPIPEFLPENRGTGNPDEHRITHSGIYLAQKSKTLYPQGSSPVKSDFHRNLWIHSIY